ncbi:hypothetical protein ANO14919_145020 [Xylariales sp. No.14919]|nr:hypothetical protein ANO14919_145020 [Xylariales sp. No.14919]
MCGHLMTMMRCFYKQPDVDYDLLAYHLRSSPKKVEAVWNTLKDEYNLHEGDSSDEDPPEGDDLVLIMAVIACMYGCDEECWGVNYAKMSKVCKVKRSTIQTYCSNFRRRYIGLWMQ